jgi:hypothetical protein
MNRIAHGRGRRTEGNPRAPLWDWSTTPAARPRQPRDETGSCGSQPAYQSLLDRRLQRRPLPCATFDRGLAAELIGRRTLMPSALETGHESGATLTVDTRADGRCSYGDIGHVGLFRRVLIGLIGRSGRREEQSCRSSSPKAATAATRSRA